jgi:bacterioferritin
MNKDNNQHLLIVDIEIQLKGAGLSGKEMDERIRQIATDLRSFPYKSVGIYSSQIPDAANGSLLKETEGTIALSLAAADLPAVIELLHDEPGLLLKGPNGAMLDFAGPISREQVDAWLHTVAREADIQNASESGSTAAAATGPTALPSAEELRAHARQHIESGAITEEYLADRQQVVTVLNQVLATELVCILRYKDHYHRASGINAESIKTEFLEHVQEAQQHADQIAARIVQLNGAPDFNPEGLITRSLSEFKTGATLTEMIKEDLIAERIAVELYSAIIRWLGDLDLTTRKVMQDILSVEARHAEDMKTLLGRLRLQDQERSA